MAATSGDEFTSTNLRRGFRTLRGHLGSLSTIHANSAEQALTRLAHCVLTAGVGLPHHSTREAIALAIHLVVHVARVNGRRRVTEGRTAALTHWSFGQLATIASAPPNYLRTLPAAIASSAINFGLQRQRRERHKLLVERTAPWTVHAVTSQRYARVHHDELASRVLDLMAGHPA